MNNDELKKKIVEVLFPVIKSGNISCNEENACKRCWFPCEIERTAGRLADALIAAGIGDVETVQNISVSATAMAVLEAAQAEHRAEVAERALLTACVNLIKDKEDNVNMELLARVVYTNYLRKAKKELAEEEKDDNN